MVIGLQRLRSFLASMAARYTPRHAPRPDALFHRIGSVVAAAEHGVRNSQRNPSRSPLRGQRFVNKSMRIASVRHHHVLQFAENAKRRTKGHFCYFAIPDVSGFQTCWNPNS